MKSPCVLTFCLLLAATSFTSGHAIHKHHSKSTRALFPRVNLFPRFDEIEPNRPEPEGNRPRPAVVPVDEAGGFHTPSEEEYKSTVERLPNYKYVQAPEGRDTGVFQESGRPGHEGFSMKWASTAPGVSTSTREMQDLNRRFKADGQPDVVRYVGARSDLVYTADNERIKAELKEEEGKTTHNFQSWLEGSPLDRLSDLVYKLSMNEALVKADGMSQIHYAEFEDMHENGESSLLGGTPFSSLAMSDARPAGSQDPPTLQQAPPGGLSPVVENNQIYDQNDDWFSRFKGNTPENSPTKKNRRSNPLTVITGQVNSPNATTADQSAQFQAYLFAYFTASSNIAALLFPYLDTMLAETNSSLAYNTAWSLYADLTGAPMHVSGPFFAGLNCIDWIEETWRNETSNGTLPYSAHPANSTGLHARSTSYSNGTANSTTGGSTDVRMLEWLLAARTIRPVYESIWANVSKAANESGWLTDMQTLGKYLSTTDKGIITPGFLDTVNFTSKDMGYFTIRNETVGGGKR